MRCAHLRVKPARGSVRAVRAWVMARARENGMPAGTTDVVELLTSELVANAVIHGGGPEILVRTGQDAESFTLAVTDASDALPVLRRTGPEVPGGQGMRLVDRLSAAWGVEACPRGGKEVWFRVLLRDEVRAT